MYKNKSAIAMYAAMALGMNSEMHMFNNNKKTSSKNHNNSIQRCKCGKAFYSEKDICEECISEIKT